MSSAKVSINLLTKNRCQFLKQALLSIERQTFTEYEVVVVNDGSTDNTAEVLANTKVKNLKIITHEKSLGITASRQEALAASQGEYVAILDDDDEWLDQDKLKKQVTYLDKYKTCVLAGGGIKVGGKDLVSRPETDAQIRRTMLFRNDFFTSTVTFRRETALKAGGFVKNGEDLAEDYDLWLRLGKLGQMYNFQEAFTLYRQPTYNKEKFRAFLAKQLALIYKYRGDYPGYWPAALILKARLLM